MLPRIDDKSSCSLFLDLDGTLVELADRPDATQVSASKLALLQALRDKYSRAIAVISGRTIAMVDKLLFPLKLPVAGVHGLERRDAAGVVHFAETPNIDSIALSLENTIGNERGVLIERKAGAVALHYRLRPDLERRCEVVVQEAIGGRDGLRILPGKMVFEITPVGYDKGTAINAFLTEEPFSGRTPIFAGDDVTDESGFVLVNARSGFSIKIGDCRSSTAKFCCNDVHEFGRWLFELSESGCGEPAQ